MHEQQRGERERHEPRVECQRVASPTPSAASTTSVDRLSNVNRRDSRADAPRAKPQHRREQCVVQPTRTRHAAAPAASGRGPVPSNVVLPRIACATPHAASVASV